MDDQQGVDPAAAAATRVQCAARVRLARGARARAAEAQRQHNARVEGLIEGLNSAIDQVNVRVERV